MAISIDAATIAKYAHVCAVRRSDGMIVAATRKVVDAQTPIRWQISVWDKERHLVYQELPLFEEGNKPYLYKTSELLREAAQQGFADWYHLPVALVEAWPWDALGKDAEKHLIPKYSPLDPTEYPID
jgi:hypothetical protein